MSGFDARGVRRFWKRLVSTGSGKPDEERLREEIEEHLAMQTAENLRLGMASGEARRQAALKFGAVEAVKEEYRDGSGLPLLETLARDTRHALRRLRKAPAFTLTTIATLALGIGATTSIFTLVHAVLIKSLAVAKPSELYRLGKESRCCNWGGYTQEKEFSLVSYELYRYLRRNTDGFSELAAFAAVSAPFGVRRAGSSETARGFPGEFVSGNYFTMFGVHAYAGRLFTDSDNQPGAPPVVVMSYRLWHERYGADRSVIGSVFDLNSKPFTVVGIAPPSFYGDTLQTLTPDLFLPLTTEPFVRVDTDLNKPEAHWLELIGRIKNGVQPSVLEAQMRVELKEWLRSHWGEMSPGERARYPAQTLFLRPGGAGITSMREQFEHWLNILMMVSGFALLIVCANVAQLMLVRGMEQRRQISLSMALGARRSRMVRQALTESALLALFGGAAGLAVAFAGTRAILHFAFPAQGAAGGLPIDAVPSLPVLLFACVTSLATAIAFGMLPAWMATGVDPMEALHGAHRSTVRTGSMPRKTLVVFQSALALVLLAASGLLTAALERLEGQNFGFEQSRRTLVRMDARLAGYRSEELTPLYQRMHDRIAEIPGVESVALCTYSPFSGNNWGSGVRVEGHPPVRLNEDDFSAWNRVTAGYFDVLGNRILRGRGIGDQDTSNSRHVAVVNEAFVRKFFRGEDPLGRHFGRSVDDPGQYEVVGVAQDARYLDFDLDKPVKPMFFLPEAQHDFSSKNPNKEVSPGSHFLHDIVVVTKPGVSFPTARVRKAIASINDNLPIIAITSLKEQVDGTFKEQRLIARLTSFFGLLSLVLSCMGLYGLTAYNAGRRTSEIGVRIALGANRGQIVSLVLSGAFALVITGLILGLPLALGVGRFLGHELYGTDPFNPVVMAGSIAALGLSALIAALIPALRASLISPLEALRTE